MIGINTNMMSLFGQRALNKNTSLLGKSINRLSTGFKINSAADNAAGLAIAQMMTADIRGIEVASNNAADGISMLQTADGALSTIQDNLQEIRELAVQGSNGTLSQDERDAIQLEIDERINTINDIADGASFNGINLLDGSAGNITLQTGPGDGDTTSIDLSADLSADSGNGAGTGNLNEGLAADLAGAADVSGGNINLDEIDQAIANVSAAQSSIGASMNGLESRMDYLSVQSSSLTAARSRIMDTDVAQESSIMMQALIRQQSSAMMLTQANAMPSTALTLLPLLGNR